MNDPLANILPEVMQFADFHGTQLVFLLGLIMFFGSIGGRLFQKLKIPQVVGYIVIGIIIGSSGFQVLGEDTIRALNPVSTIALSFIGFLVGAELKFDVIRKYGKQFIGILIGESFTPFFVVGLLVFGVYYLFTRDLPMAISMGLVLGAICSATAPAATTDVLKEFRTRGPLTTTILGIVAMDDAVALVLYAISSTLVGNILGDASVSFGMQMLNIAKDILGSIFVGSIVGFIISRIIQNIMEEEARVLTFALGGLFLSTGVCELLGLDNILAALSIGFFMVNFAPAKTKHIFVLVEKMTPPIYVLFFVLVGAKLNIWVVTPLLGLIAVVYVAGRSLGKTIGARIGAKITHAPETVYRFLPWCLLSQAGVAIGLSIAASNDFPESIGPQIMLIITATTFIVQLLGPVCVKHGVTKAGEVGLAISEEDILKKSRVGDIKWGTEVIASASSTAIVNELDTINVILDNFETNHYQYFAVCNEEKKLIGLITLEHLKETLLLGDFAESMLALDIMDRPLCTCSPSTDLPSLYKMFSEKDVECIPIIDGEDKCMGVVEKFAVDHYIHNRVLELHRKIENLG